MNGQKVLIWVFGCLTLVGTFGTLAITTGSSGIAGMWATMAVATFLIGYITLLCGIVGGFFD